MLATSVKDGRGRFSKRLAPYQRFYLQVEKSNDGCWRWKGHLTRAGYGNFFLNGHSVVASRASWILHFGDPGELQVCHTCDNPSCVKPDHLFLGTQTDNLRDMADKKRGNAGLKACKNGHPFDAANTYKHRRRRNCRACNSVAQKRRKTVEA